MSINLSSSTVKTTTTRTTIEIRSEELLRWAIESNLCHPSSRLKSVKIHDDDPWKSEGPRAWEPSDAVRIEVEWTTTQETRT